MDTTILAMGTVPRASTFQRDLDLVLPALSPKLVGPGALATIRGLARRLPSLDGGFEVRLLDPERTVELSVGAWPDVPSDLDRLAQGPAGWPDPTLLDSAVWRAAVDAARQVVAADGPERRTLLWLEFDRPALDQPLPEPCLFLQVNVREGGDLVAIVEDEHRKMTGGGLDPRLREDLDRLAAGMPAGTRFPSIGVLHGRAGTPLRVRFDFWPVADFAEAASSVWGDAVVGPLRQALAHHPVPEEALHVTLDLRRDAPPRFGLPIPLVAGPSRGSEQLGRLQRVLDRLVADGLCTPGAAQGLLDWPGHVLDPRPAPGPGVPVLFRMLLQLKLAYGAEGRLEAKAYLGLLRRRLPHG